MAVDAHIGRKDRNQRHAGVFRSRLRPETNSRAGQCRRGDGLHFARSSIGWEIGSEFEVSGFGLTRDWKLETRNSFTDKEKFMVDGKALVDSVRKEIIEPGIQSLMN